MPPLYRGMSNLKPTDEFLSRGGTELAPCSTTSKLSIATKYGLSVEGLLLKVDLDNSLSSGVDIQWLSAYPQASQPSDSLRKPDPYLTGLDLS